MGKKSIIVKTFVVSLSITQLVHHLVKSQIKSSDIGGMIYEQSGGAIRLINEEWKYKNYFGYDHVDVHYTLEIDRYNVVKNMYNRVFANLAKLGKGYRDHNIYKTICGKIEKGFNDKLYGIVSMTMASFIGVKVL